MRLPLVRPHILRMAIGVEHFLSESNTKFVQAGWLEIRISNTRNVLHRWKSFETNTLETRTHIGNVCALFRQYRLARTRSQTTKKPRIGRLGSRRNSHSRGSTFRSTSRPSLLKSLPMASKLDERGTFTSEILSHLLQS